MARRPTDTDRIAEMGCSEVIDVIANCLRQQHGEARVSVRREVLERLFRIMRTQDPLYPEDVATEGVTHTSQKPQERSADA